SPEHRKVHSFPTRRSSDLPRLPQAFQNAVLPVIHTFDRVDIEERAQRTMEGPLHLAIEAFDKPADQAVRIVGAAVREKDIEPVRSEEHTSELQSLRHLVCR